MKIKKITNKDTCFDLKGMKQELEKQEIGARAIKDMMQEEGIFGIINDDDIYLSPNAMRSSDIRVDEDGEYYYLLDEDTQKIIHD